MSDRRASEPEFLDDPAIDDGLATDSYRLMETVNRYFGGARVVLKFLSSEIPHSRNLSPVRLLDIGAGSCDIPIQIIKWARLKNIQMHITCLEKGSHAARLARLRLDSVPCPEICLLHEDVFAHEPAEPYDYALASMSFHHLSDEEIVILLNRLRRFVTRGVLINDLRRSAVSLLMTRLFLAWGHDEVRHDAMLSIRRGFTQKELYGLLRKVEGVTVSIRPECWFRISARIGFSTGA
jgi:hypothetical protein